MKCPPPSLAILWFMNVHERKPRQKKKQCSVVAERRCFFLTSSLLLTEILQNHFFRLHNCNNHTTLKFHMDSQVDLNMNKASNFDEKRRNHKNHTKPYNRILEATYIQVSSDTDVNILLSRNNYLCFGITYLLAVSTRTIGWWIIKTKQHLLNHQKMYLLFCFVTPLLQVSSDTPTSGINYSMKIQ